MIHYLFLYMVERKNPKTTVTPHPRTPRCRRRRASPPAQCRRVSYSNLPVVADRELTLDYRSPDRELTPDYRNPDRQLTSSRAAGHRRVHDGAVRGGHAVSVPGRHEREGFDFFKIIFLAVLLNFSLEKWESGCFQQGSNDMEQVRASITLFRA